MAKSSLVNGTVWTTVSTITTSLVHLLRLAVLARLLTKADFGLVAIISVVLGLTQTLSDLGFSSAIMHKKDITREEFSSLYWIQFVIFITFYFLAFFCKSFVARFYNEPSLLTLLPLATSDIVVQGFGKLYDVLAQKNYQFKILAIRNIIASVTSLAVAICLALLGLGVLSLVISSLVHTLILQLWNFIIGQRYIRLKLHLSIKEVVPLVRIGLFQMGTQIFDYISSKIDVLLLGRFLGTELLGVYNLAKELVLKLVAIINTIANRVVLPYFSEIQHNNEMMRNNYCKLLSVLSYINFPICVAIGTLSYPIVSLLYGQDYLDLAPIVTIFSIWGLLVCVGNPVGNIVTAKGRTDLSFIYTIIRFGLHFLVTLILAPLGIYVLAFSQVILAMVLLIVAWHFELYKTISLRFSSFIKSFGGVFCASVVSVIVCFIAFKYIMHVSGSLAQMITYGVTTIIFFSSALLLFDRGHLKTNMDIIKSVVSSRR